MCTFVFDKTDQFARVNFAWTNLNIIKTNETNDKLQRDVREPLIGRGPTNFEAR